jgi:hypothetical protein
MILKDSSFMVRFLFRSAVAHHTGMARRENACLPKGA